MTVTVPHSRRSDTTVLTWKGNDAQTTNVLDEARDLVEKRLAELDDERKRLERALAELGGKARRAPASPAAGRKRLAPTRKPPRRRASPHAAAAPAPTRRSSLIEANPGISASEIAKTDEDQAELPLPGAR